MEKINITKKIETFIEYELTIDDIKEIEENFNGDIENYLENKNPINEEQNEEIQYSESEYEKLKELTYNKNTVLRFMFNEIKCNSPILLNEKQKNTIFKLKEFAMSSPAPIFALKCVIVEDNIAYATDSIIFIVAKNFGIKNKCFFYKNALQGFKENEIDLIVYSNTFGIKYNNKCFKYHKDIEFYNRIKPIDKLLSININENKFKKFFPNNLKKEKIKKDYNGFFEEEIQIYNIDNVNFEASKIEKILKYFNPTYYQIIVLDYINIKALVLKENNILIFLSEIKK